MAYAFPNAAEIARERLEALHDTYDPASFRRAEALGVGPGWRCLDVGAGGGSFARWLARRGADVVAADLDVRFLDGAGVEARQMDVRTDDLEPAAYDLVHTRLLLLHLPERDEVLERLIAAVKPGGLLLLEEDDIHPILATASGAYREAWVAFYAAMQVVGVDAAWARGLPQRLDALGLVDVDAELSVNFFRGGEAPARFWSLTWQQVRDDIIASGTAGEVVDAGCAALGDPARWFIGPACVITWGRRPG